MFDCNDDVAAYHDEETTLPQADRTAMRDRRDANRDRLENRLEAQEKPTPQEFIKQGSYAMLTMVQDPDNDYDIDDGVYFTQGSICDANGICMSPKDVRLMVCDALKDDRFNKQPEVRTSCVRIHYNEGYHVDMPIYRIRESDGEYELAMGDAWTVSRAADVADWFNDFTQEHSPDEENGRQFRRITRLIKKFGRSRAAWKAEIAPGFTITKLASEAYAPDADRDDLALRNTMRKMHDRLWTILEVDHPVTPNTKLTKDWDDAGTKYLRSKLADALRDLEVLDAQSCSRKKALAAWDKVFNTDFFSLRDVKKMEAAAAYRTAPAVITNPARPWTEPKRIENPPRPWSKS
jgi:hypothetical protein